MAKLWLWNSIATRKRSPTDGFLENGLALLKSYLEDRGHSVRVIDWHKNRFYDSLCYGWLRRLNRVSTAFIFWLRKRGLVFAQAYYPVFNIIQEIVSGVRIHRMKYYLRKLGDEVASSGIRVFGIKVWYGEAFTLSDYLAGYIKKKAPSVLVIAGGFHVTLYEDDFLKNSVFDLGVVTEGEKPLEIIMKLADELGEGWSKEKALSRLREKAASGELKNVVYRDGDSIKVSERYEVDMAGRPLPKYDPESIEGKARVHVLLDSLGCPWGKCNFCVHWHFYPKFCPRPVEDIVSEMEAMVKNGVALFRFAGSETPPAIGVKIAQGILDRGLKLKYSTGCRAVRGIANREELYKTVVRDYELMLKSGLVAIFMGGESANDIINDKVMNKGVSRADIIDTVKAYREAIRNTGIRAYINLALIYPTPLVEGVTMEQVFKEDIDLIKNIRPDSAVISPCTPFKNTRWFKEEKRFGFKIGDDFVESFMKYEYVMYKPPSLWKPFGSILVNGMDIKKCLEECGRMRSAIEDLGISTDLTDEYFLMIESAGYEGMEGFIRFKNETAIDLISSDYPNIERITKKTNEWSRKLALLFRIRI